MSILEINDVSYRYKGCNKQILNHVQASFEKGKLYAIVGASGSGKSTLLSLLAGLDTPQEGSVLFQGENILQKGLCHHRKHHISLVFQSYNLIDYMTPYENMRLVKKTVNKQVLLDLGLDEEDLDRTVLKLSGGQQQRSAIARSLVSDAPVILADEPTGNLDSESAGDIVHILKECADSLQKCVIVVTHSKEVAKQADVIYRLKKGHLFEI